MIAWATKMSSVVPPNGSQVSSACEITSAILSRRLSVVGFLLQSRCHGFVVDPWVFEHG